IIDVEVENLLGVSSITCEKIELYVSRLDRILTVESLLQDTIDLPSRISVSSQIEHAQEIIRGGQQLCRQMMTFDDVKIELKSVQNREIFFCVVGASSAQRHSKTAQAAT